MKPFTNCGRIHKANSRELQSGFRLLFPPGKKYPNFISLLSTGALKKSLQNDYSHGSLCLAIHVAVLFISFSLISCRNLSQTSVIKIDTNQSVIKKNISGNNFLPPVTVLIDAKSAPHKVIAGKPIIEATSSKEGNPFFINYGTKQGLVSNLISSSLTDHVGNIWFTSTGGGVSKFDGKTFTNFTRTNGLAGNVVLCMIEDRNFNLWFGTTAGVSKFDGKKFTTYSTADGLPSTYVLSISKDSKSNLWFGTRGRGITRYDGRKFMNLNVDNLPAGDYIQCSMEDNQGKLWFGTERGGVICYDGTNFLTFTKTQGLAGNNVQCILQDDHEYMWFGTGNGLSKYDGKKFTNYTTRQGLPENAVTCITQDKKGEFWIGSRTGGICRFDGIHFRKYTIEQGLTDNNVSSITEDKNGNIWFTSIAGGVTRCIGDCLADFALTNSLRGNIVFSIAQDKSNNMWFATENSGAARYNGVAFESFTRDQGLSSNNLWNVMSDKEGNLWFGTDNSGVSKYDGTTFTNYSTAQGLPNNVVWKTMQDKQGNIWLGTNGGASRFDGHGFTNYTRAQGLPGDNIQDLTQDKDGNIWFATHDDGVSKFNGKGFANYSTAQGLASNTVYSVTIDKKGNIWFGTNNGVSKYDGIAFTNYTSAEGLADNNVWAVADDSARGIIWLTTNQGISGIRYDSAKGDDNTFETIANFNDKTGYPIGNLSRSLLSVDRNGALWAGSGDHKIIRFNYSLIPRINLATLQLQSVQINNENICWNMLLKNQQGSEDVDSLTVLNSMVNSFGRILTSKAQDSIRKKYQDIKFAAVSSLYSGPVHLVLPYQFNSISFDFTVIDPDRQNEIRYQYQLEGYDKDWSPLSGHSRAVFGNLPEGSYTFNMRAQSAIGMLPGFEFPFKILPPWQRTWWAYLLYILFFISIISAIVGLRSRALKRENRILEEKVNSRTIQLQQSLKELKSTQSQLVQREKMASLGELTAGIAHEIQNPLNFVNNFSELNGELLTEMKQAIDEGKYQDIQAIASDLINNEQKINQHGKRADAIVKGMLQHSRKSEGSKEPTDINALAEEYLKLAYHGMKAKEQDFNVKTETRFDANAGLVDLVSQDIGRVLLNLYSNAFYAVWEKKKYEMDIYIPEVTVITRRNDHTVSLTVKDNGDGISKDLFDKIFQPFFTTKPAGKGTGLGLSLSYDIIKAHDGEIKVETKENQGSEFIILLPIK